MKFLVTVQIKTEAGNTFCKTPHFTEKLQSVLTEQKAESVYFGAKDGHRTCFYVANVDDASKISALLEPWWHMGAETVQPVPVLTMKDMQKAEPEVIAIAKQYGGCSSSFEERLQRRDTSHIPANSEGRRRHVRRIPSARPRRARIPDCVGLRHRLPMRRIIDGVPPPAYRPTSVRRSSIRPSRRRTRT